MAFNPFHTFRKHQKVIFAVLTIICMFVFILTGFGGRADPLSNLLGIFGGRHQGDKVVTLYGHDLYQSDLTRLAQARTIVNHIYLGDGATYRGPVWEADRAVMDELVKEEDARDKEKADRKDATDAPDPNDSLVLKLALRQWKEWNDPQNQHPPPREEQTFEIEQNLKAMAHERETTKSDDVRRKLDAASAALRFEYWVMNPKPGESQRFFFGGSTRTEDLLDFEIWKRQADRLGVVLTREDVRKEAAWDAAGRDVLPKGPWKDDAAFKSFVAQASQDTRVSTGPTEDDILNAITDEYRVSIAQTLLMGRARGVRSVQPGQAADSPDPVAPFDFYTFYRNNRTTLKTAFLALPVESFMEKVDKEIPSPSEEDLQRLFDRYRDQVPEPTRAAPAFKEPRRVLIEYVTAKPDSPFYKSAAAPTDAERRAATQFLAPTGAEMEEAIDRRTAAQLVAATAAAPAMGGAPLWAGLAYGGPQAAGRAFLDRYERDVQRDLSPTNQYVDPLTNRPAEPHDPTARHAEAAVAVLGRVLGGALSQAGALAAPVSAVGDSTVYEANDRIARGAAAWLAGVGAGAALSGATPAVPSASVALSPAYLTAPILPAPPPPAVFTEQVFKEFQDRRAPEMAFENLNKFIEELTKLKNKPDEAKQYVAKAVKDFGFELHAMERPKEVYELAADPNVKDLKDAFNRPAMFNPGPKPDFTNELISSTGVYDPKRLSSGGVVQGNGAQSDQNAFFAWMLSAEDRYVFWRSVDDRAHELSYGQARAEVVKAWKFQEARKLALAEANRIDAEALAQPSPVEAVKYLRDQKNGEVFELSGVARLVTPLTPNVGVTRPYVRYTFDEKKITFPPKDLLDRLMELEKPGQTLVFKDQPQKEFFVAVLEERVVPAVKDKDFLDAYEDATQPQRSQLWSDFFLVDKEFEERLHTPDRLARLPGGNRVPGYEHALLRQLRAEAGTIDEKTGKLVVNVKEEQHNTPQGVPQPNPPDDGDGGGDFGL